MRRIKLHISLLLALSILLSLCGGACAAPLPPGTLEVHFIDVGHGDAALILCGSHTMLIDGGKKSESDRIYAYLKERNIKELDYIVCTHPHKDHAGGLAGALSYAKVKTALCSVKSYDSDSFESFKKHLKKQDVKIRVPDAGDVFQLGEAEFTVVGPLKEAEGNNNSLVIKLSYGDTSFLFSGDAEYEEEKDILAAGYDLSATVLKTGHHGSKDSTSYEYLYEVHPQYAVISVGKDDSYGLPDEDLLSRLRDADVSVYRTDLQGTVICRSDGKNITFTTEKGSVLQTLQPAGENSVTRGLLAVTDDHAAAYDYILNANTHKFHYPECASVQKMKEENKEYFTGDRSDAIARGFSPCGNCKP